MEFSDCIHTNLRGTIAHWSLHDVTQFNDKCIVKGSCEINSYCTPMDAQYDCLCLPGFKFKDPNQHQMGLFGNFSEEDCIGKKDGMTYSISPLKNAVWLDNNYEILSSNSEEDCKENCLGDCF